MRGPALGHPVWLTPELGVVVGIDGAAALALGNGLAGWRVLDEVGAGLALQQRHERTCGRLAMRGPTLLGVPP